MKNIQRNSSAQLLVKYNKNQRNVKNKSVFAI